MNFKEYFNLENTEEIPRIIEELECKAHRCRLNKDDWKIFVDYHKSIKDLLDLENVVVRNNTDSETVTAMYDDLTSHFEEINHIRTRVMGRTTRVAIADMNGMVRHFWWKTDDKYYNAFYDMKDFVEMVNAYFHINEPYKQSNKIAYGWQFALEKGFDAFRPYLYGCIRNYLNRNNIEFEVADLQKICCLKDITDEDC